MLEMSLLSKNSNLISRGKDMNKNKLLIITQKVDINDDVLGFMHGWIKEFAKNCESVIVVCLKKGEYDLPDNVKVLSLGKESISQKFVKSKVYKVKSRLLYIYRFYKYIWQERKNYDTVFVHMNKEYVVFGGVLWRMLGKKIGLWYAHGYAPLSLKIAEKLAHVIFTPTMNSFRLESKKIKVVGHGIDLNKFGIKNSEALIKDDIFKIVTIGRISPVKDYETLIKAVGILNKDGIKLSVDIIGRAGLPEQEKYLNNLKQLVIDKGLNGVINFKGAFPNKNIAEHLVSADVFVNTSRTGSLDKAILEAMACGLTILTCNEAMPEVLGEYKEKLMFSKGDYKKLAEKIKIILKINNKERYELGVELRKIVEKGHSLRGLVKKILNLL
jgi:glycosyltransferase involved in cell wall biosynthesis